MLEGHQIKFSKVQIHSLLFQPVLESRYLLRRRRKTFIQKQIEHPFSLGNMNIISDKNAVYEREIVLVHVQIWLPQPVVFFLVNRTFLWLFLAVFRGETKSASKISRKSYFQ